MVDSKQNLQVNPTDQMVYYLQQHSTILSQISQQIASIAPQFPIPSTPPLPFPPFNPSASNIRINVFWFMALAFSLSAALLAILVQQWVRDYMHVFQRYSDPQKSARMRQYLYEGSETWYMPIAANAVPVLLHVSLFLFFAGLADSTLDINTTIGLSTTVPIGICGLLYIFITLVPVIYPQSPYQTSFSGVIWYALQKFNMRSFKDRDGKSKSVSPNMTLGQMQLSTEGTMDREGRDKRAILWLLDNLTEDDEIEKFVMSMPGSLEAWTELSKKEVARVVAEPSSRLRIGNVLSSIPRRFRTFTASHCSTNAIAHRPVSPSFNTHRSIATSIHDKKNTIREFCWRIGHFFDTCKDPTVFASDKARKRSRACVEAMASLVSFDDVEVAWFGDILQVLGDIGSCLGTRDLSLNGRDQAFVVHWTCLSIMAIRPTLKTEAFMQDPSLFHPVSGLLEDDLLREAPDIGITGWDLSSAYMKDVFNEFDRVTRFNAVEFDEVSQTIIRELPGVDFGFPDPERFLQQTLELFDDPPKLRFISCRQPVSEFTDYLKRVDGYRDNLSISEDERKRIIENVRWPKHLLQRMLWSIDDFRCGGLGFSVELFLLSLRQLLPKSQSQESYSALYIGAFKDITSDRRTYKDSVGTQKILLDIVASDQGFLNTFNYPDYITNEVWELLGDVLEGAADPIVDSAVQQLVDFQREVGGRYRAKASAASALISRLLPFLR